MSVASATATCGTSGTPAICLDSNTTDQSSSFGITWTDSSGYKAVQSENQAINNLVFQFGDSISHTVSDSNGKKVLTATTNSNSLSLYGNSASIQLDQLKVDFGNNTNKSFTLDLSNIAAASNFAFSGDIAVNGSSETNRFSATLGGKGLQWSIDIDSKGTNSFVFTENGSVSRIWSKKGTNTYTFNKDATISSGSEVIYTGWYADGDNQAKNTFIFKGNTTIKSTKDNQTNGNENGVAIWVNGNLGTTRDNTYNHMTFSGATNKIIGKIVAVSNNNTITTQLGENLLTFDNNTVTNTIQGEISSSFGYNTITLNGTTNTITGNIVSSPFGTNTIKFENTASTNTINGNITANGTNYEVETQGGLNELTFSGTTNTITGSIIASGDTASAGTNRVNFTKGANSITQKIEANNGGKNEINANQIEINKDSVNNNSIVSNGGENSIITSNLTVNGNVYARSGNGNTIVIKTTGSILGNISAHDTSNTIKAVSGTLTIGASGSGKSVNMTAKGGGANGNNTITANTLNAYIDQMKAGEEGWANYTNEIIADSGNINIQSLNTYYYNNSGVANNTYNKITLKSGILTIGSISSSQGQNRHSENQFMLGANDAVTANISGNVSTSGNGAKVLFDINNTKSTLTFGGNITNDNNGVTNIVLRSDSIAVTLQGAQSTITTLTAVSSATSGNTLTLDATNNSVTATIKTVANGENLNVIFNGKGASKEATLKLNNTSGTTLKNISIKSGATTGNILEFSAGANSILGTFTIGSNQDLSINLSGANTSLNLVGGLSKGSGSAYINIANGANATLSGGAIDATKLSFAGTSALTINNSSASLGEISIASGANATLKGEAVRATTLSFAGTSALNLANEGATITGISVASGNATLEGIALSGSNLTFADNTSLTLNNAGDSFGLVNTTSATNGATLTIGSNLDASIAQLQGNNLKVNFAKREQNGNAKLSILDSNTNNKTITLKGVSVANDSTNNTLDLSNLSTVNIGSAVSLAKDTGLTLNLRGTALAVTGGLTSINGGDTLTEATNGTLTISVDSGASSLTATGGSLNITNLEMVGSGKATLSLKSDTEIANLTAQASGGNVLEIDSSGAGLSVKTHNLSGNLEVAYKGSNAGTLVINGGTHTLSSVGFDSSGKGALTLNNTFTTIASEVSASTSNTSNTLALTLRNSELELAGATNTLTSLDTQGSRIDLSGIDSKARATERKTLTIGTYKANSNSQFVLYADSKNADKVTFSATDGTKDNTSATISIIGQADLFNVTYKQGSGDNVELVDASQGTAKDNINIVGGQSIIGGILAQAELIEDSGKYYIGKVEDRGLSEPYQEIANTALTVNYDLFLANFNSLNKRMGELRDNPHSQGVWARVFGGAMSNDFGAGSKSEYVTAQAGYDYSLTLGDANNYMGIAIAYGKSWTKSNDVSTGGIANGVGTFSLDEVDSNMVEVGIYNSYVMDSGWYNDTIFKFDYIMSEFSLSNDPTKTSTNNFAMVLSDEFGYRYKFAESEKGNWYIDPQVEVAFGYFNQSDFNRMIYDKSNFGLDVEATQDAILNLRTRAGMSLGKKFNTAKGFASLYVGAFYEYDYINGGDTTAGRVGGTVTQLDKLESNGRAIINVGSNIELTEGVRMYIDVEKSFGDKQRVDMQFNFGARYSFGEKTPTISYQEQQKKRVAPLKVEDKQEATQESKIEASANTQATSEQEVKQ